MGVGINSFHGPQNEENLNGTHPVLLAALQCNSDVQLPYRLCEATHDDVSRCADECYSSSTTKDMVEAAQAAQDSQAGYACDYQNKRAACSCNEVKECVNGPSSIK